MPRITWPFVTVIAIVCLGCQRDRAGNTTASARTTETTTVDHSDDGGAVTERTTETPAGPAAERGGGQAFGLPVGWQLAPGGATYSASQTPGEVIVKATGENPSAGYETKLFPSPLRIYPPQFLLGRRPPGGPSAQVITPFEATTSFRAKDPVRAVTVSDVAGRHEVTVDQARD
jgi:hypothetical protein